MSTESKPRVAIKKYPNRRMYDTVNSRYVNLSAIAQLIKGGNQVEVSDASTGEDLTKVILTQIILEEEKDQRNLLPADVLHQLIEFGESAYGEFLRQFLSSGFEAYRESQQRLQETLHAWMPPWPIPGAGGFEVQGGELEDLKRRLAELERRLAEKNPGG